MVVNTVRLNPDTVGRLTLVEKRIYKRAKERYIPTISSLNLV